MIAVDRLVEPTPTSFSRSITATESPRAASCHAVEQPTMPPPTTIASGLTSVAAEEMRVGAEPRVTPEERDHRGRREQRAERQRGLTVSDAPDHQPYAPQAAGERGEKQRQQR